MFLLVMKTKKESNKTKEEGSTAFKINVEAMTTTYSNWLKLSLSTWS